MIISNQPATKSINEETEQLPHSGHQRSPVHVTDGTEDKCVMVTSEGTKGQLPAVMTSQ